MIKIMFGALIVVFLVGYEIVTPDDIQDIGDHAVEVVDTVIGKTVDR